MIRCPILGVAGLVMLTACGREPVDLPPHRPAIDGETITFASAEAAPNLSTTVAHYEPAPTVRLNGRLVWDEDHTVRIYSPFAGRVSRILVQPGSAVNRGQTLAVLGSPEFGQAQADARRAATDLKLAESNLQRQKELESHGVAPRKDLQTAEAEYARAQAELERARGRVRMYGGSSSSIDQAFSIASPIAGIVVEKNINPGQELRPDQMSSSAPALFVVTDPSHLWALLDASEKDLATIQIGKTVTIRSPVYPDEDFSARIVSVADFLDPATRTLKVRATLDNPQRRLKAEMFVTAELETKQGLRMQVPAKAVFFQGGQHYVFTDEGGGRYVRRDVRVGEEREAGVAILEGLQEGQRIVADDVLMLQQMLQPRRVQK